ncbi:hypothetical protein FF011L_32260 [Roseimaritima multifibrata]|uniref:Uncharacterized protein n=1 Tax=Roseimaritima multifibrata TaxID=1930274 RepID=A0A517MI24_9BACT|nr:hypothetical protein [Roseimaritima multifibrata]QDS94447.1 hypothetical protein FF011L_32260 [Roseimaritima multifibrata]
MPLFLLSKMLLRQPFAGIGTIGQIWVVATTSIWYGCESQYDAILEGIHGLIMKPAIALADL